MAVKVKIKGGQKLKRYLADLGRNRHKLKDTKAEIGFFGPQIASLAFLHELGRRGRDGTKVPARPAFGAAREDVRQEFREALRGEVERKRGFVSRDAVEVAARAGLRAVRESYMSAPGPPVGERQAARKKGTPGEGKLLVGTEGPKLAKRLEARINGQKIGE